MFAESDDGKMFYNIGITHSKKRGHHKNLEIKDPTNWNKPSYVRDDLQIDDKDLLKEILRDYKLHPKDYKKIWDRIIKRRLKK